MQQNDVVKKDLQVCNLSEEEIQDPYLVFINLDLPGLKNISSTLLRAAMNEEEFEKLTPEDKTLATQFSSEVCRMLEALHLLCIRGEIASNPGLHFPNPGSNLLHAGLPISKDNNTPASDTPHKPIYLTEEEMGNPREVIEDFFSSFSLSSVISQLNRMMETCMTTDSTTYAEPRAREDLLYEIKNILKVLEAMYIMIESMKGAKLIVHDFRAPLPVTK